MISGLESPFHLLIILVIALLVLGPKRLREAGRALGGAVRSFKDAISSPEPDGSPAAVEAPVRRAASDGPVSTQDDRQA
jgi:sec-independent protein translocase protein TatA